MLSIRFFFSFSFFSVFRAFEGLSLQNSFLFSLCFVQTPVKNIRRSNKQPPTSGLLFGTCGPRAFFFGAQSSFSFVFSDENKLLLPGNVGHKIQTIRLEKRENPCREVLETGP